MKKLFAITFCILIILNFSGCLSHNINDNIDKDRKIVIGVCMWPLGFHPWMESYDVDTLSLNSNIFNGLVEFDKDFRITPGLATSWNNPDNRTWRFFLRENVKFHNGYNFSTEDVKYTIDMIKADNNSILREMVTCIEDVVIMDNYTVDIITEESSPILLNNLVEVFIVSKKYQEENNSRWPIGTGGFKLVEFIEEDYISLERFDRHWKGQPEINKVEFKLIPEGKDRKTAILAGEIDIGNINPEDYDEISTIEGIEVKTVSTPTVMYLSFDLRENDSSYRYGEKNPLSDVRVRKAIYHAIDIERIIEEELNGFAEPASQFVSPNIFGYNPNIQRLSYDPDSAKSLMKDAGYEMGFELDIDCVNDSFMIELCEEIASQIKEINIDLHINAMSPEVYLEKICSKNSSFFLIGWIPTSCDSGEIFDYILMTVDEEQGFGAYNYGCYSNPEVDFIGRKAASIMNPAERLSLLQEGFSIANGDIVWIPLYIPHFLFATKDDIDWVPRGDFSFLVEEIGFK